MRIVLALIVTCWLGVGLATTTHLKRSSITARTLIQVMPREVTLEFTQPVRTDSSRFKVYRLNLSPNKFETLEFGAMERMAQAQTPNRLRLRADAPNRADAGLRPGTAKTSNRIHLQLKPGLEPGAYAVMWQIATNSQHETGSFVFLNMPKCAAFEPELKPENTRRPNIRGAQGSNVSGPRPQVRATEKPQVTSPLFRVEQAKPAKPRDRSPLFRELKPQPENKNPSPRKAKRCQ
jgi:copper resistance protein C